MSRRYGPRWTLVRVSFEVDAGGALMLVGANGSGKTTLLRCLATALRPHDGAIRVDGRPLWDDRHALRPRIAMLGHAPALYADLSASENLRAWASMGGLRADVPALLARVGLADTGARPVRAFSAGMTRRLALARLLIKSPSLLLLDEPFSALDPPGRAVVADVVRTLRAGGTTVVLTTHHPALAAPLCDHAIRLDAGRVAWRGAPTDPAAVVGEA